MKITLIPSWYNSVRSPARGSFIKSQAKGLSSRGHDISIIVLDRDSDRKLFDVKWTREENLNCVRISVPAPMHRILGFYLPSVLSRVVRAEIKKLKPDLVHAHAARPAGVIAKYALTNSDIPYVLTEHSGPIQAFWWTAHGKRQIAQSYEKSQRLFAVSNFLKSEMLNHFGSAAAATRVLYNGIDTDLFRWLGPPPDKGKILFVGGLESTKGLNLLFTALAKVPNKFMWTLTIVGEGKLLRSLRKQASDLRIADRIYWVGPVEQESIPKIYSQHDFVVIPSVYETFSLVCAEALACGRPVIASRCGGPEEVLPEGGGILIPNGDSAAMVEVLVKALSGNFGFDAEKNIAHVENKFSLNRLVDKLESVYADVIGFRG